MLLSATNPGKPNEQATGLLRIALMKAQR